MAGETIFAARNVKHPTDAIAGVTHAGIAGSAVEKVDQGDAGSPGPADAMVPDKGLRVNVYGKDYAALLALVGAVAANVVIGTYGAAAALEKHTIKNVMFTGIMSEISIPEKDSGGKLAPFGVSGIALWGAEDTFALMVVAAVDS